MRRFLFVAVCLVILSAGVACASPAPSASTTTAPTVAAIPTFPPAPTPVPPTLSSAAGAPAAQATSGATSAPTSGATAAPTRGATTAPTAAPSPSSTGGGLSAATVEQMANDKFNNVDRTLALWAIQPGLGTVMIEYGNRLARLWFAGNASNWDMAKYQLDEMTEIQEVGETTRPARATALKAFEQVFLSKIDKAIASKDKAAFTQAMNDAVTGCNGCHAAASGAASAQGYSWKSYQFVKIQLPKTDPAAYIDWKGGGQDNYVAATAATGTATPRATLSGTLDAAGIEKLINGKFNTVDRTLALWNIQPGLGTVMIEYGNRFSRMYYAAKAGNWDMAKYQHDEMVEIQEVGEITRPGRAQSLQAFEKGFLDPIDQAITAKDSKAFDDAFAKAVDGCNGCHAAASGAASDPAYTWKSYRYVRIQVPTADNNDYIVSKADKGTGNYISNPPAAATATPKPPLTGNLDQAGVQKLMADKFNNVDTSLALWNIQPGLGTVMIEYARRFAQLRYALDAGNWDMAKYQLDEMIEIQEVGETTRPGRATMLKAFEDGFLKPMDDAILAKDKTKADTAYKAMIGGCNGCHAGSKAANWSSYAFVQIQAPPSDPADYVQWNAGAGTTGNYVPATQTGTTPTVSATGSATTQAPTGATSAATAAPTTGATTSAPTSATAAATKASSGPPRIPADHVGRTQCLVCHATGVGGAPTPPPAIHASFPDDPNVCKSCHIQATQ